MKIWKRILLAIFSIILIFNLNLIVYTQTIQETILNPQFFQKELDELNFYPLVKENLLSIAFHEVYLDEKLLEVLNKSISESWLRTQTNSLLSSTLDYLNSETAELTLEVSTLEVKRNLKRGVELPPAIVDGALKEIPDTYNLLELLGKEEQQEFKKNLSEIRKYISYFHLTFYLLIASLAILILLIILLARKLKSIFRRLGAAFFISGSSLYFGNFLTMRMVSSQFIQGNLPAFLPQDILLKILQDFLEPINFWGIVLMVLGILMIAVSFLLKGKKKEEKKKVEEK